MEFWSVKPEAYPIPDDGPVGELLAAAGRGPMRPAHVHFKVTADGYQTLSIAPAPGIASLAFWVAQMILDGQEVPKDLTVPFLRIDQDNLETNLANTEKGGVANTEYTLDDAKKVMAGRLFFQGIV